MRSAACPFCEHINPAGSKFCNACGTPMHLVPCARCGAVNDPLATSCHQCAAALLEKPPGGLAWDAVKSGAWTAEGRTQPSAQPVLGVDGLNRDLETLQEMQRQLANTDSGASATARSPAIRIPQIGPRRRLAVIVGTVVLAVLAAAGYYAYREPPVLDIPQGPAARGTVKDLGSSAATGADGGVPSASTPALAVTPPVAADPAIRSGGGDARSTAAAPVARSSDGTTSVLQATTQGKDPSEATPPLPAAVARPRSAGAGSGILERQPPRVGPCTDGAAALGLCAPESIQRRE